MINCPKCGNPLQVGEHSCPICGTNIETEKTPLQKEQVIVSSVAGPVNINNGIAPKVTTSVSEDQTKTLEQTNVENKTIESTMTQPKIEQSNIAQTTQSEASSNEIVNSNNISNSISSNSVTDINLNSSVIEKDTPIPKSLMQEDVLMPDAPQVIPSKLQNNTKNKFVVDKKMLIIGGVAILVLVIGIVGFSFLGSSKTVNKPNSPSNLASASSKSVTSHGFKFLLENGWQVNEDGTNVIITNSSETVAIKLDHTSAGINTVNKAMIEDYMAYYPEYDDVTVNEMTISTQNAYLVNTRINNCPVQVYFFGTNMDIIGVTIVYQSDESKNKYEVDVTKIIGSLTYINDSSYAISTIEMYKDIFSIYGNIVEGKQNNQNENNNSEIENEQQEEGENPNEQDIVENDNQDSSM